MILSAKYELMRKNFRNFAETEFTTEIQEQLDREGGFNWDIWNKMAKYGFTGCKLPVEYGGQGGDSLAYVLMNEEFSRCLPSMPTPPTPWAAAPCWPAAPRSSLRST